MAGEHRTWVCSVLFMDIVSYTKYSVEEQIAIRKHYYSIVSKVLSKYSKEDYATVDAGDGMAIAYTGDPEDVLVYAINLRNTFVALQRTKRIHYRVRLGVNLGPARIVRMHGETRVIGDAINVSNRVMSFASDNQLLISRSFFDVCSNLSKEYASLFIYLGRKADKHRRYHAVYEYVPEGNGGSVGDNPEMGEESRQEEYCRVNFDPKQLSLLSTELNYFVGPIAQILVKRAAQRALNFDDLVDRLADEIDEVDERSEFSLQVR
ncbi:MAG: adenylate/guanylate cyclase domain-containing protein [Gammaproteobacteria bacterium]|nr:adenylate/guanylate cyclase domain-containing protein [Gammaproteobacteria bacterium]